MTLQEKDLVFVKQTKVWGALASLRGQGQISLHPGCFWARPLGALKADPRGVNASTHNGLCGGPMTWRLEGAGGFSLPPATPFPRRLRADTGQHREHLQAMLPAEGRYKCKEARAACLLGIWGLTGLPKSSAPHTCSPINTTLLLLGSPAKTQRAPGRALWVDLATRPSVGRNRPCLPLEACKPRETARAGPCFQGSGQRVRKPRRFPGSCVLVWTDPSIITETSKTP